MLTHCTRIEKATHCYVGTAPCGCDVMVVTDNGDRQTAKAVAESVRHGETIRRMTIGKFRAAKVPFGCRCKREGK